MSNVAYDRLRDAIVRGELHPGEKIKDSELAARMGLSRTPVREALTRLVDTGLVEAKPGVYTRITTLNRDDVAATLAVLRSLDELAVRTGVPNLTKRDLAAMRRANQRFSTAVEQKKVIEAFHADDDFHGIVIGAANNPVLSRVIEQLHPQIHRILYRKFSSLLGGRDTIDHHAELIELCARGDATAAATLSSDHWSRLGGLINELFESNELT
jgi:DNA-binding GntR family transcriptional regulator